MLTEGYVLNQRYQILRVLSDKGGMGVIYQATDLSFNNTVVIKHSRFTEQFLKQQYPAMPPDQLRSHAEYLRKAFEREAKLLRGLKHHALPSVIDYFTTGDGNQFFVMDFIPGKDFGELLDERLRQNHGPFPLGQVLDWADQLLDALDYLHTRYESPIVHRDLKPSNLKLTPDGRIVLLDFGLAKGATPGMSVVSASIHGYTMQYAPLEQIRGKGTSVRSDLYSLAVTLHHLLSGAIPPSAVDRVTDMTSGEDDPLRPLHELNPQIPAATSEVIQRAAALNPNERYATAAEMREALRRESEPETARSTVKLPDQPTEPMIIDQPLPPTERGEAVSDAQRVEAPTIARAQPPAEVREAGRVQIDLSGVTTRQPEVKKSRSNRRRLAALAGGSLILVIGVGIAINLGHWFGSGSSKSTAPTLQSFVEDLSNGVKLEMIFVPASMFDVQHNSDNSSYPIGALSSSSGSRNSSKKPLKRRPPPPPEMPEPKPKPTPRTWPFYIGKYEVTQAQWKAIRGNWNPSHLNGDNLPVENVPWDEADKFCKILSDKTGNYYRLPTQVEWQYACLAGTNGYSTDLYKYAWYRENSNYNLPQHQTHPVGQLLPNALGLCDMRGNLWEWCNDSLLANEYERRQINTNQSQSPLSYRALRGGSWNTDGGGCSCTSSLRSLPTVRSYNFGFRVVMIPKP